MFNRRKDYEVKRAVVYSAEGKQRYISNLNKSREIRDETIKSLKFKLTRLLDDINELDTKINNEIAVVLNLNASCIFETTYTLAWESKINPVGTYGPYWLESYLVSGKKKYKRISSSKGETSGPSKRLLNKYYGENADLVNSCKRNIKKLKTKKINIGKKFHKLVLLVINTSTFYGEDRTFFKNYCKDSNGRYNKGLCVRETYFIRSLIQLDALNADVNSIEKDIDKKMYLINIETPKRYKGIFISWELFSSGKNRKSKKLSPFGPIYPQWRQINRWTPNIHGKGVRQIKNIKLSRAIIYKGQQGIIAKEMIMIGNKINRLEKERQIIIKIFRSLWRSLSTTKHKG